MTSTTVITDADLVNKYAKKALEEPEKVVETKAPLGPEVKLPGGLIENGELITTVEVRELNGVDEEAIAKASTTGKALNILLQRGLVKVGSREATLADLDNLLSGDRDAILIGIRKITFGKTMEFSIVCGNCAVEQPVSIDLEDDVPVKKMADQVVDRTWRV